MKMKTAYHKVGIFLAAMLLVVSCGGSSGDLVGLGDLIPDYTNSKLLKKVTVTETGSPSYDVNFGYGGNKLSTVTTTNNSYAFDVLYTGNQISKITKTDAQGAQPQVITAMLGYTGALLTAVTGTIAEGGVVTADFTTDYSYNAAKAVQVKTTFFTPGTTVETGSVTSQLQYAGDNISKWIMTIAAPGVADIVVNTDFSDYDNSQNPYRLLPRSFTLATCNFETSGTGPTGLSANNYRNVTVQSAAGTLSQIFTHTYDAQGFLSESSSADVSFDFEYQSL